MKSRKRDEFIRNYNIHNSSSKKVRFLAKKGTLKEYSRRVNENPNLVNRIANRLGNKGIAISLAITLVFSGISIITHNYTDKNEKTVPIEKVIKNEEDLEDLGILPESYQELQEIKKGLNNSEIQLSELEEYKDKLEKISIKIGKYKIATSLKDVDDSRINLINNAATNSTPAWQAVVIKDTTSIYENYDANGIGYLDYACSSLPNSKHKIDDKIANYISNIAWLQSIQNPTLNNLNEAVNNIEQFACYGIQFKDGNFETNSNKIEETINSIQIEDNER